MSLTSSDPMTQNAATALIMRLDAHIAKAGLPRCQWRVLLALHDAPGGLSVSTLANTCLMQQPTMTKLLDRMVRNGRVSRDEHPMDRRAKLIRLTDKGALSAAAVNEAARIYTQDMTMPAAVMTDTRKLNQYIAEGRLIRHAWTSVDDEGRKTASLLTAMSPEVAASSDASVCPAHIMPQWLAHLTPWMDDNGTVDAWPKMVRRYAAVAARWHVLSKETWRRLDFTARRIAVEDCLPFTGDAAPAGVLALLRRAEKGEAVNSDDWAAAEEAAWFAAWAAQSAARSAAQSAAWAAAWAARSAARAAEEAAMRAAEEAAVDRITAAILGAIERACDEAEKGAKP